MQDKVMNCYDVLAEYYNRLIDCDYDKWSQFLIENGCTGSGIDLACGTGNITFRLAEKGCNVIGIDMSPQMLAVAEGKKKNVKNPMFRCQNMTEFCATKQVDFVSCVCDGINYVKPKDLKTVFERVYNSLKKGGVFIFDVSSAYKLKTILGNNFFYQDEEDMTYFWTNELKKDRVNMQLSFFVLAGSAYRRFDEEHTQYIYGESQLVDALREVGFDKIETFADYKQEKVKDDTQRITFKAEK